MVGCNIGGRLRDRVGIHGRRTARGVHVSQTLRLSDVRFQLGRVSLGRGQHLLPNSVLIESGVACKKVRYERVTH